MDCLDELSVDLQEGTIICIFRVASKFYEERPWTLGNSFSKAEVQLTKGFFQADLASIAETDELNLPIGMRWLRRWVFIINMLIEVCLFPYVSDSSHVAVDVQRK